MARLRTFLAVDLGPSVRARCVSLQETLGRSGADVKWVEEENLHVTLLFLGEVDAREVLPLSAAVKAVCARHAPFTLRVEGVGCFPNPRRPRVVWAGLTEGGKELIALHDDLADPKSDDDVAACVCQSCQGGAGRHIHGHGPRPIGDQHADGHRHVLRG